MEQNYNNRHVKKKVVFLYSLLTSSVNAVLSELIEKHKVELTVFYKDDGGNKPFQLPDLPAVDFRPLSKYTPKTVREYIAKVGPDLIYVVAWQERKYLSACNYCITNAIPVVSGFDDNYIGSARQVFGSFLFRFIRRKYFSHAMVSGPRQYHYAMKFGFRDDEILYYLFSADNKAFSRGSSAHGQSHLNRNNFLFVGRYDSVKGVETLADAFRYYREVLGGRRELVCFGNGPKKHLLENQDGIHVNGYASLQELDAACSSACAFVLPSTYDPSPLVVHEMALKGLPLILSTNVGNRHMFLIDGYNGFLFDVNNAVSLAKIFSKVENMAASELKIFGQNSATLSLQHSPEFVAASLLSVSR